jgi:hypothetical protein
MPLERELVKQGTLIDLPLTQHHLHSRCDNWSESAKQHRRNLRVFQQNRPEGDFPNPTYRLPSRSLFGLVVGAPPEPGSPSPGIALLGAIASTGQPGRTEGLQ